MQNNNNLMSYSLQRRGTTKKYNSDKKVNLKCDLCGFGKKSGKTHMTVNEKAENLCLDCIQTIVMLSGRFRKLYYYFEIKKIPKLVTQQYFPKNIKCNSFSVSDPVISKIIDSFDDVNNDGTPKVIRYPKFTKMEFSNMIESPLKHVPISWTTKQIVHTLTMLLHLTDMHKLFGLIFFPNKIKEIDKLKIPPPHIEVDSHSYHCMFIHYLVHILNKYNYKLEDISHIFLDEFNTVQTTIENMIEIFTSTPIAGCNSIKLKIKPYLIYMKDKSAFKLDHWNDLTDLFSYFPYEKPTTINHKIGVTDTMCDVLINDVLFDVFPTELCQLIAEY